MTYRQIVRHGWHTGRFDRWRHRRLDYLCKDIPWARRGDDPAQ